MRDLLLSRFSSEFDFNTKLRKSTKGNLSWASSVSGDEAKWVAKAYQNKSLGADGITVRLLKAVWSSVKHAQRALYEGSLRLNYSPKVFKQVEVILLPKAGDQSSYFPPAKASRGQWQNA